MTISAAQLQGTADLFGEMGWRLRTKARIAEIQIELGLLADAKATLRLMMKDLEMMEPLIQRWVESHPKRVTRSRPSEPA